VAWLAARAVADEPADLERIEPSHEPAWTMFRDRGFTRLLLVNWLLSTCWDVHSFMVPVLGHLHEFSASAIGAVLGAFAIAATIVRLLMPLIAKRLREREVIIGAQVVTALVFVVYPLVDTPLSMGALSMVLGFALGSVQPMVMSTLHVLVPPERIGQAIALRLMVVYGSSVVMPLIFGAAGATVGAVAVFWVVGGGVSWGAWLARRIGQP
jgi:predicted MFS family arabinose efflux permease